MFLLLSVIIEIPVVNANSVDPDQTPQIAASDLYLHCLSVVFFGTLSINWLKVRIRSEVKMDILSVEVTL